MESGFESRVVHSKPFLLTFTVPRLHLYLRKALFKGIHGIIMYQMEECLLSRGGNNP